VSNYGRLLTVRFIQAYLEIFNNPVHGVEHGVDPLEEAGGPLALVQVAPPALGRLLSQLV
jgi:hypothetical protein